MLRIWILVFAGLLSIGAQAADPAPAHHEISLHLDPESRSLLVEDRITLAAAGQVTFDLAPWLTLTETKVDGAAVVAERSGRRVSLPASGPGSLLVVLQGTVPALPPPDARGRWPGVAAGAEGSVLLAGEGWLPDAGAGPITYRLTAEVPAAHRVVATGRLIGERTEAGRYSATFESEGGVRRPSVFAGPYTVTERREDAERRLRTYFHPELQPLAEDYLKVSSGYIARFAARIGAYPFADFHVVSAPFPVGLGFPNMTYVGRRVLPLPFMRGRSLAHEVLHNWWGNGVGVDYAKGNWAEGLTSYMADYALAVEQGDGEARRMRLGWLQNFAALPEERDRPAVSFVTKRHDASQVIGYDKVAFSFLMLEAEVGEAAFTSALRQFWQSHRFSVAGWADLRRAFETATERELGWFFEQWLTRAGAPQVELAAAARLDGDEGHGLTLTLRQDSPAYRLRLPIMIETAAGRDRQEVVLTQAEQTFELASADAPRAVLVDPDFEVFRRLLPGESPPIFRDVTLSQRTLLRLPTDDEGITDAALTLAGRLLQRAPEVLGGDRQPPAGRPILVIGLAADVTRLRDLHGPFGQDGDARAGILANGTARAWAERHADGTPWLFVAARDAAALKALERPLPHYRSRSYVVFDGSRAIDRGHWPVETSPLIHRFDS